MFRIQPQSIGKLALLLMGLILSSLVSPAHAQDQRCFPETNRCISGRFRQYWEQNGGLAIFGFPLTPARSEQNRDTGQTYLTQWFERNRFELHPENAAPYDVLLGRLGEDRLLQSGRNWREEGREGGPQAGCLWFEETGHNVCNQSEGLGFRQYWETHGLQDPRLGAYQQSLALFGLPLTAPRTETNSSGHTVLTQWFERARFEWHPNNPAEYRVLLGRLGDEVMRAPGAGERPTGRIVYVGRVDGSSGGDLYVMNADGTGHTRLTNTNALSLQRAEYAVSPAGDRIAYRAGGTLYVIRSDGSGQQTVATTELLEPDPFQVFAPTWAPDGSYLAYVSRGDIYATRLDGSDPVQITRIGEIPSPSCLSWARNGYLTFRTATMRTFKLFVVRSDGSDLRQIAWGTCGFLSPAGDRMAYTNGADLWIVNLDGSNARPLTSGRNFLPGRWSPDGTRIAVVGYSSDNGDDRDIWVVDAANGQQQRLTTDARADLMTSWSPDGKFIAFASNRTDRYGVYVIRTDGGSPTLLATPEESAAPQWLAP